MIADALDVLHIEEMLMTVSRRNLMGAGAAAAFATGAPAATIPAIYQKSYKRECQETFFSARLRRRMLSCIQPPTSSNSHVLWPIVLDLAQQQRDSGFRFLAFSCL
jgi:hypothetical protein